MHNSYHSQDAKQVIGNLDSQRQGLSLEEAEIRLSQYGLNEFATEKMPNWFVVFLQQFKSPLIYILLCAMIVSMVIREWSDSIFIAAVLMINATIGAFQEHGAEKTAQSLRKIMPSMAHVLRAGENYEIQAEGLVPGDIILLESGIKIPADCRLISSHSLEVDESLLTGESLPIHKQSESSLAVDTPVSDRINMVFSGTLVTRGRGKAIVVVTGQASELGKIADFTQTAKPPLLLRMEKFTRRIAYAMGVVVVFMLIMSIVRGTPLLEMFYLAVALAVAAIPEGLPVALTIALAIGMRRMANRNVIVRKLVAVEALGSCTYVGSDKTGTLTVNELTVRRVITPSGQVYSVSGEGIDPGGEVNLIKNQNQTAETQLLKKIAQSGVLTNEGLLAKRSGSWVAHGDSVDIALLIFAHKLGVKQAESQQAYPEIFQIPYESEKAYSATCCQQFDKQVVHVKGAPEQILSMCSQMMIENQIKAIDQKFMRQKVEQLAFEGYRVLAICQGEVQGNFNNQRLDDSLRNLVLLGFVGIIDPLRKEVPKAIAQCQQAGLRVTLITGDHPITAYAIARDLNLIEQPEQVITGQDLTTAYETGIQEFDRCTAKGIVYARVSPQQKMQIIESVSRQGHFVAVTGDGVNDVPALRAAHVGVAMGKRGTDVARESSSIIITDDNFASIVAGVEEGRIAYANIRKVIYFLISTGVAEVLLFVFTLLFNLPMPLLPVQLLWLNIVTQGIQDVALAFEEPEGNELKKPPRNPKEPIFNKLMLRRVILASFTMSMTAFGVYYYLLEWNFDLEDARNMTLLLMVLFENIQAVNCRSESQTLLKRGLLGNKFLLLSIIAAQGIHIAAMHIPGLNTVLDIHPVSLQQWAILLCISSAIFFVVEAQKFWYKFHQVI